ncbi:RDD family protein [Dyella sp.]|jgi:uncharacterized RDD family membrane protein YckC|uniref:RDD family protein n=1 Tax=Dyella sp. TaxID=1869338 RepID=UPI002D795161|nr:RDD family protein [Dyella sp.]HET6431514.1 RDD family protein [Dyella sp.]
MDIWIGRDGERHGPYKETEVRQWLRNGQASGDDLGWYEGLADWQPLATLFPEELKRTPDASYPPPPPVSAQPLPQASAVALEDYAGFWQRFGAWLIDYLILLVPSSVIAISMGAAEAFRHLMEQVQNGSAGAVAAAEYAAAIRPATLIMLAIGFVYYVLFEASSWQATPGKMALSLRVTDIDGNRLSMGRSAARNAVRLLNIVTSLIPFLCYLVVAFTPRKQGLHDMLAKALVLNGRAQAARPERGAGPSGNFSA